MEKNNKKTNGGLSLLPGSQGPLQKFVRDESGTGIIHLALLAACGSVAGVLAGVVGGATASIVSTVVGWVALLVG